MPSRLASEFHGATPQTWRPFALRTLPAHPHQAESIAFVAPAVEAAVAGHTIGASLGGVTRHHLGTDSCLNMALLRRPPTTKSRVCCATSPPEVRKRMQCSCATYTHTGGTSHVPLRLCVTAWECTFSVKVLGCLGVAPQIPALMEGVRVCSQRGVCFSCGAWRRRA